ncbi:MAG TPA: hydrogenase maturation nickel metallochaperone HypA [Sporichthyaceae bacterium]|nr:hydrogenase maturation nickel metallochaperone HypA [Sporichthyaceae bacterium]
MHELSLCGAIAEIVTRRAGDRRVQVVHLQIGQLRQVVPDALTFCWTMLTEDTDLDGSTLDVDRVAAVLTCRTCGTRSDLPDPPAFACVGCGGLDVAIEAGEEFAVTALDLIPV